MRLFFSVNLLLYRDISNKQIKFIFKAVSLEGLQPVYYLVSSTRG